MTHDPARGRYFMMVAVQIVAALGAALGLILAGRSTSWELTVLGGAILLSGLYVIAVVPRAMARRWRTPPPQQ